MQAHIEIFVAAAVGTAKLLTPPIAAIGLAATGIITQDTSVPLTIAASIGGGCWYLNGRFTKIEDSLDELKRDNEEAKLHHSQMCPVGFKYPKKDCSQEGKKE